MKNYKKDFPIFNTKKELVYLNSSATTLKPKGVIDVINKYYSTLSFNNSITEFAESIELNKLIDEARNTVKDFINANDEREIIFTQNCTMSLNILALGLELKKGDEVIINEAEHASNLLP
jgi:cysteine desulfurase/selenocysteine lyase